MLLGSQSLVNDPYYNDVVLLLRGYDATSGQVFKDYSKYNRTITANGNVAHSTTQKKHGNSSIYFDGNGDYLSIPASSDFSFGVNPFTIEFWVNATFRTGDWMQPVIGDYASPDSGLLIALFNNTGSYTGTAGSITCGIGDIGASGRGVNLGSTTTAFSSGNWNHFALVRNGSFSYLYINGTLVDTRNIGINTQVNFSGNIWRVGIEDSIENGSTRTSLNGGLDDLRITRRARDIVVPTQPFPNW